MRAAILFATANKNESVSQTYKKRHRYHHTVFVRSGATVMWSIQLGFIDCIVFISIHCVWARLFEKRTYHCTVSNTITSLTMRKRAKALRWYLYWQLFYAANHMMNVTEMSNCANGSICILRLVNGCEISINLPSIDRSQCLRFSENLSFQAPALFLQFLHYPVAHTLIR